MHAGDDLHQRVFSRRRSRRRDRGSRRRISAKSTHEAPRRRRRLFADMLAVQEDGSERPSTRAHIRMVYSDQEMILHPLHSGGVGLGHDRAVGHHALWDAPGRSSRRRSRRRRRRRWRRHESGRTLRTVANMRPSLTAWDRRRHGINSPFRMLVRLQRLHDVVGGGHVVIVEEGGIDLRVLGQVGLPQAAPSSKTSQSAGWVSSTSMFGILLHDRVEAPWRGPARRYGRARPGSSPPSPCPRSR